MINRTGPHSQLAHGPFVVISEKPRQCDKCQDRECRQGTPASAQRGHVRFFWER
jgi:hypothetical protein